MTTGSDGRFEFSDQQVWPPGTPNLSGGASGVVVAHDCSDRVPGFETTTVSVDLRGRAPDVSVAVAPGAAVVGTLLDAQHLPLAGYCVYVGEPRSSVPPPHAVTDSAGHFTVNGVIPGAQRLVAATGDCGWTLIAVEPQSVLAAGITPVVATVSASEDSLASARVWSRGDVDQATMHTIGATVEAGEASPSCFPAAARTTWRRIEADNPTILGIQTMRGTGAVAIYGQDDSGGRGPELACSLVTGATPSQIPFGGMRPGRGPTGSALGLPWYWIQLASGPEPVVVDLT